MQDRPICFQCDEKIEANADMVFEAPCGHDEHASAVFHGICLFTWREKRTEIFERIHRIISASQEHSPDCPEHPDNQ